MKSAFSFGLASGAIVLALFFLSSSGRRPTTIPADEFHQGMNKQDGCLNCHAPGRTSPLKERHPPKEQCLVCHRTTGR